MRLMFWFVRKLLGRRKQKNLAVAILNDILKSKGSNIDNETAERIITIAIKSSGNKIVRFIVKD